MVDPKDWSVRVYTASTLGLQAACTLCVHYTKCDHEVVKPCLVPCG